MGRRRVAVNGAGPSGAQPLGPAPLTATRLRLILLPIGEPALKVAALLLSGAFCAGSLAGQASATKPREESMASDRFAEAHAPLFRPPSSPSTGAVTDRVARSLPAANPAAGAVPMRNFIDEHIFGKMRRDGVPHAPLSSDYEFL